MKRTLLTVIALALMAGPALAVDLIADGGDPLTPIMDVGEVTITNDATNLIVTITIDTGDWEFVESHVHAAEAVEDIPQAKKATRDQASSTMTSQMQLLPILHNTSIQSLLPTLATG